MTFRSFFSKYAANCSCVHLPTFFATQQSPLVLLAVAASGAMELGTSPARDFAEKVFGRLSAAIQTSWQDGLQSETSLDFLVVAVLLQQYRMLSGTPQHLAAALLMHGPLKTLAEYHHLFDMFGPCYWSDPPQVIDTSLSVEMDPIWRAWVRSEVATRFVLMTVGFQFGEAYCPFPESHAPYCA